VFLVTRYGLQGRGIESRWGEIFRTYPDRLRSPSSLLYNGYRVFSGCKGGRNLMLTTHPLLVPRLRKSWAIPLLTLWVLLGLLRGSLYPFIMCCCRSLWPRGLRRRSAASRLLRLWVRIPPGAWKYFCFECCVLSDRGLCDELITRPEESYRL
jgi:hypothetical protein